MSISTALCRDQLVNSDRDVFAHWAWAIPVLLIVAALGVRQIDLYPPGPDEFYSMYNAGFLVHGPYTPFDVIESLYKNSPNHTPGYFLLLSLWGNLTSYDLAIGRILTILGALLSIAVIYRLARDFIAPVAGLFAIIIVASNAFYSFYIPNLRMYPLLVCLAAAVLWLYLRIVHRLQSIHRLDYAALGAAVFALLNVHAYSVTFLATIAVYHVFLVQKTQRWKYVAVAVCAAMLLAAPWYLVLITRGMERAADAWSEAEAGSWDTIAAWLNVTTNGQPLLLALSIAGLFLSIKKLGRSPQMYLLLAVPFLLILGLLTDATSFVQTSGMRYQLAGWPLLILAMVAGLFALYSCRKWLGVLVVLWVIAGARYHVNTDWKPFIGGLQYSLDAPPWQVISRQAARSDPKPLVIGYRIANSFVEWPSYLNYSQSEHYFDRLGLGLQLVGDPHEFGVFVSHKVISSPRVWVVYQKQYPNTDEIAEIDTRLMNLGYDRCQSSEVGVDNTILHYSWRILDCKSPDLQLSDKTDLIDYRFYGLQVDHANKVIEFVDAWSALTEFALDDNKISYQLVTADWDNVAQLELPLVHADVPRRFSIDISDVPAGSYRLMTILYNVQTNERLEWDDNYGTIPAMLALGEIEIPSNR